MVFFFGGCCYNGTKVQLQLQHLLWNVGSLALLEWFLRCFEDFCQNAQPKIYLHNKAKVVWALWMPCNVALPRRNCCSSIDTNLFGSWKRLASFQDLDDFGFEDMMPPTLPPPETLACEKLQEVTSLLDTLHIMNYCEYWTIPMNFGALGLRSHGQLEPHCIRKKPRVSSPAEIAATVDSAWRLGMWRLNMVEHCYENMEWRGLRRMERRACVLMAAGTPTTLHLRDWNAVRKNTCQSWMLWEVLSEESCALFGVCAPFLKFEFQPSAPKR